MKKFLIPIFAASVLFFAGYVRSVWTSYHNFEGMCESCHLRGPGGEVSDGTFTRDITAMCGECHGSLKELSHPVDMAPSMEVPAALPLDWKGEVTCATCHTVHREGHDVAHLRVKASGEGFCMFCHAEIEEELHKVGVGTAHARGTYSTRFVPDMMEIAVDELSHRCLTCHDAMFGVESLVERRVGGYHSNIGLSHPIGVSYVEAKFRYMGAYRDIDKLPPQIKLFAGTVGCGSCHNPYSKEHASIVMSNERSALCLACHVK